MDLRLFDSLESTNKYCELLDLTAVEEFTVVCAREQTAGIGQRGNVWHSEPGKNLTFSLVLKPTFLPFEQQYMLTKAVSLGVADCLASLLPEGQEVSIKWPNDIYIGMRKVCGILISNHVSGSSLSSSVVGIGLNVNQTAFPKWIPNPVSLKQVTGREEALEPLLRRLVECIALRYGQLQGGLEGVEALDNEYLSRLLFRGEERPYLLRGERVDATIVGVNRFGHLDLTGAHGEKYTCQLKELVFLDLAGRQAD